MLKIYVKRFLKLEENSVVNYGEIVPDKGYKIVFCEDPFGNIIETYSNGYEQTVTSLP